MLIPQHAFVASFVATSSLLQRSPSLLRRQLARLSVLLFLPLPLLSCPSLTCLRSLFWPSCRPCPSHPACAS